MTGNAVVIKRKSQQQDELKNKLVDLLRSSAVITDKFCGEMIIAFQDGNIRSSKLVQIDPLK